jgi:asparagine synthase (glutamine-hydrolysing)
MKNRLPALLYDQPKKGFPTPLAPWFRGPLRSHIYDTLTGERAESRGVFSTPHIRAMLDAFCKRRADTLYDYATATRIFALYSMELWFRIFIDASAVERPEETFFERPSRPLLRETSGTT